MRKRGEIQMIQRAVKNRWPIPEEKRPEIVEHAVRDALDPEGTARSRTAAARVLVSMDSINIEQEQLAAMDGMNPIAILREQALVVLTNGPGSGPTALPSPIRDAGETSIDYLETLAKSLRCARGRSMLVAQS
jgi:hypothetical protein